MKRVAIHDAEADHFGTLDKFPNYALMKISAFHKAKGDSVEWFMPLMASSYDLIYSSKVFDFTPDNPYLPASTIKGGTGYGLFNDLPDEIDRMFPDYSIYPNCDYAIGFLTRGCPNNCPWCYVPQKEGKIRPYRTWQELVRPDTKKLTLMDNNILACPHGLEQLRQLAETDFRLDINQAMSVFLITPETADILARCKWGIMSIEMQEAYTHDEAVIGENGEISFVEYDRQEIPQEEPIEVVTDNATAAATADEQENFDFFATDGGQS